MKLESVTRAFDRTPSYVNENIAALAKECAELLEGQEATVC
jgi:hypothetical protein